MGLSGSSKIVDIWLRSEKLRRGTFSSATLGTGIRLSGERAKIDLALQFAQTGSVETNELETRSIRLYVGVAGAETWTRGRRRR